MNKKENKIIKILRSYAITVKIGSGGDYEQYEAIVDDEFVDLTKELVEKLIIPDVVESCVCNNKSK